MSTISKSWPSWHRLGRDPTLWPFAIFAADTIPISYRRSRPTHDVDDPAGRLSPVPPGSAELSAHQEFCRGGRYWHKVENLCSATTSTAIEGRPATRSTLPDR